MPNNFDTNALIGVIPSLKQPSSFLLDKFFPNIAVSDTAQVTVDVVKGQRRMSPFVHPMVEGKLVEGLKTQSNIFRPAYIKDKRSPDLTKPLRRAVGERIGGEQTAGQRELANIALEMEDQVNCLTRRLEWMAASALQNAKVIISGDGYDSVQVDFARDAELTKALTGNAAWNAGAGASPTSDLEKWATLVLKKSGAVVTDVVFTPASWEAFKNDPKLEKHNFFPTGSQGNETRIGAEVATGGVYKGQWGNFALWLYNDWYIDDAGVEQPMLADGSVIMSGACLQGTRAFGSIMDPNHNYAAMPFAPKTWIENDPAVRFLMLQSAPLIIPSKVDASICIQTIE